MIEQPTSLAQNTGSTNPNGRSLAQPTVVRAQPVRSSLHTPAQQAPNTTEPGIAEPGAIDTSATEPGASGTNPPKQNRHPSQTRNRSHLRRGQGSGVFAALDLGTNNCRLLVARRVPGGHRLGEVPSVRPAKGSRPRAPFRILESYSRIVRLGEGLALSGELGEDAITRTLASLKACSSIIANHRVDKLRCIATEACRAADNCDDFLERVRRDTGLTLELISGQEEAQLGFMGCAPLMNPRRPYALVFDIGGGSTEISWLQIKGGHRPRALDSISLPMGVVTLAERYAARAQGDQGADQPQPRLKGQTLSHEDYSAIRREMAEALADFERRNHIATHQRQAKVQLIGTSGTVTTLSALVQGLERYDRSRVDGSYLTVNAIERICQRLLAMSHEERAKLQSIGTHRADLVLPGCAILQGILDIFPLQRLRVADRGLREGMLYELMAQPRKGAALRGKSKRSGGGDEATAKPTHKTPGRTTGKNTGKNSGKNSGRSKRNRNRVQIAKSEGRANPQSRNQPANNDPSQ